MRSKKWMAALVAAVFTLCTLAATSLAAAAPAQIKASAFRPADGSFTVEAELPADAHVSAVLFPVWSEPDQSDIVWYEAAAADGRWSVEVSIRDHGWNLGPYVAHCYAVYADGTQSLLGGTAVLTGLPKSGKLSVAASDAGQNAYTAVLQGVALPADGPLSVRVLDPAGAYVGSCTTVATGSIFTAQIPSGLFSSTGCYTVQACFGPQNLVLASCSLDSDAPAAPLYTESINNSKGAFRIVASAGSQNGVQSMRAAVWAQPDQSDISWLSLERAGDRWVATTDVSQFGHAFGVYTIHAYALLNDGSLSLTDGITAEILPENYAYCTEDEDGTYLVRVLGTEPTQTPLRAAVWSAVYGQDDLAWYDLAPLDSHSWRFAVDPVDFPSGRTLKAEIYCGDELLTTLSFPRALSDVGTTSLAAEARLQRLAEEVYAKVGTDLHEVYKYVRDNLSYVSRDGHLEPPEGYTRQEWYAVEGLETSHGNCYTFASSFCELAKRLGYDVEYVEGEVPSVSGRWIGHGFVLLTVDGSTYICDAVFEHSSTTGRNYYMQPIEQPRTTYRW